VNRVPVSESLAWLDIGIIIAPAGLQHRRVHFARRIWHSGGTHPSPICQQPDLSHSYRRK